MDPLPLTLTHHGPLDADACFSAMQARERRFDGWFFIAVRTTRIYCRPSCPTPVQPKRVNVDFYRSAAAAQLAGFRACKRCRPDASPGSPEWNVRADIAARALRHIADGVVDRDGVPGLARRLHVSDRQLQRILIDHLGAPPLALARAQRAHTARVLIETTDVSLAQVAFAAGFASIRQFNDTIREVFASTPTDLRVAASRRRGTKISGPGTVAVRLPFRAPYDWTSILAFLSARSVTGVERVEGDSYARTLRLPGGPGSVHVTPSDDHLRASFRLTSFADLAPAVARVRRLFDLDADPDVVADQLALDPALRDLAQRSRGRRAPGAVDGHEIALRAILGQQVSVAAARTAASRLAERVGDVAAFDGPGLLFPSAEAIAALDPATLPMPAARARALVHTCGVLADGGVDLEPGADRAAARTALEALPGIGPWTAAYVAMRALSDPDVLLATDLVALAGARALGIAMTSRELEAHGHRWAPWRSYANQLLWASAPPPARKPARTSATPRPKGQP